MILVFVLFSNTGDFLFGSNMFLAWNSEQTMNLSRFDTAKNLLFCLFIDNNSIKS